MATTHAMRVQGSENACKILGALTRRDPRNPDEIIVPSELCEEVLLCLLDVLEPAVPRDGKALLLYLLSCVPIQFDRKEFRFWPRMLRLTNESSVTASRNVVSRLRKHRLLKKLLLLNKGLLLLRHVVKLGRRASLFTAWRRTHASYSRLRMGAPASPSKVGELA